MKLFFRKRFKSRFFPSNNCCSLELHKMPAMQSKKSNKCFLQLFAKTLKSDKKNFWNEMNKTKTDERQHTTGQLVQDGHQDKEKIDRQTDRSYT